MRRPIVLLACLGSLIGTHAVAQPVTGKTPNLEGTWVAEPGLDFTFTHRFKAPGGVIDNAPTFTLTTGVLPGLALGMKYATKGSLAARPADGRLFATTNELEFWLKDRFLDQDAGHPFSASLLLDYNLAQNSFDGETALERTFGPLRVSGSVRGFTNLAALGPSAAAGLGLGFKITDNLWLAADVVKALPANAPLAWGAGIHAVIPYSPHTLALQVTNTGTTTRQGSAIGGQDVTAGFEFGIPFTSTARWVAILFPPTPEPETPPPAMTEPAAPSPAPAAPAAATLDSAAPAASAPPVQTVVVHIRNMAFAPATVTVPAGSTVTWVNDEPQLLHSTTANNKQWEQYLMPKQRFSRTFDKPGSYPYHCVPHPMMKGTIVVQ